MNGPKKSNYSIFLSLGSNINPEENLPKAVKLLAEAVQIISISHAWRTPAVGSLGPDFLNAAVQIQTGLSPSDMKNKVIQGIESKLGRVRTKNKYSARTIDIDILIVDRDIVENEIWSRVHLATPLSEIAGDITHPETGATLTEIAQQLSRSNSIHLQAHLLEKELCHLTNG